MNLIEIVHSTNPHALPWVALDERATLPQEPGIYFCLKGDRLLYVGKSVNIWHRWKAHGRCDQLTRIGGVRIAYKIIHGLDDKDLYTLEDAFIYELRPELNDHESTELLLGKYQSSVEDRRDAARVRDIEYTLQRAEEVRAIRDNNRTLCHYVAQLSIETPLFLEVLQRFANYVKMNIDNPSQVGWRHRSDIADLKPFKPMLKNLIGVLTAIHDAL